MIARRLRAPGTKTDDLRPELAVAVEQPVADATVLTRAREDSPSRGRASTLAALAQRYQAAAGNRALTRAIAGAPAAGPVLARRLIANGDVDRFRAIAEPGSGLVLAHDPATGEVTAVGSLLAPGSSPAFAALLTRIMDDPAQDAEVQFGAAQSVMFRGSRQGVLVGAFPDPSDMTTSTVQTIDLDDIENVEAGSPGHGLAFLAHEIAENHEAHAHVPTPGVDLLGGAHQAGIVAENAVLADLVGPGGRVAQRISPGATAGTLDVVFDYEHYFFVMEVTQVPADNQVSDARQAARNVVSTHVIDSFVTGSAVVPGPGGAAVATALGDLAAHPRSTATIEGFTDNVGTAAVNDRLSRDRASAVQGALVGAGGGPLAGAMHATGRGATGFVAGNATDADRARNRRVVIRIEEPGP